MQANNQPEAEAAERLAGARVTDDNIIELAVSHSNYRAEKHIGDCDDFEVISHRRLVEFGRALLALAEPAGEAGPVADDGSMTAEEIRLENLKQMAKYDGPIVSFEVRDPYYLASCNHCGWVGSTERCGTDSWGDDSDVYCPRCHASGADCGKVAAKLTTPPDASANEAGDFLTLEEAVRDLLAALRADYRTIGYRSDLWTALEECLIVRATPPDASAIREAATHRHKKRGTEYVLIGIGKMQAEDWFERTPPHGDHATIDMREVAIYSSADDGSLWVRPREEFEDGRFEALAGAKP